MANADKAQGPHRRIVVGLPDIQDQLRLVDRLSASASEPEVERLHSVAELLSELYAQLQHKKQVTIFRYGSKSTTSSKTGRGRK